MGTKKNITISGAEDKIKIVTDPDKKKIATAEDANLDTVETTADDLAGEEQIAEALADEPKKATPKKERSHKYKAVRSKVDKTKKYSLTEAIALVKKLSYTKFDGTISAHAQIKEAGDKVDITFPHSTGQSVRVAIFDEAVLAKIEANTLDFDILVATPKDMAKLTKYARVLGPKGLMPNPKNGTLTPNPEMKKKELEAGKITLKTEKKAPLIHVSIGKVSMSDEALIANLETLIKVLGGKVQKLSIASTMSPGIKVLLEE